MKNNYFHTGNTTKKSSPRARIVFRAFGVVAAVTLAGIALAAGPEQVSVRSSKSQIVAENPDASNNHDTDYMNKNFRDLPCSRIELDEQWQYVGCHGSRLPKDDKTERGDYGLWACIDADTKLVFSHKVGET